MCVQTPPPAADPRGWLHDEATPADPRSPEHRVADTTMSDFRRAQRHRATLATDQQEALANLYDLHFRRLRAFVLRRCGCMQVADDITALTFEAAASRLLRCRDDELTLAWLTTVAKRRLVDHWRDRTRREVIEQRLEGHARVHLDAAVGSVAETSHELTEALALIPERQQQALFYRYVAGLSVAEVSNELTISYKAAESLLARSRIGLSDEYFRQLDDNLTDTDATRSIA